MFMTVEFIRAGKQLKPRGLTKAFKHNREASEISWKLTQLIRHRLNDFVGKFEQQKFTLKV